MEAYTGILLQELPYQHGFVSRKTVEDDVDLLSGQTQVHNFPQESNEILAGMASSSFSVNAAGCRLQRGIEGQRAMPVVLEAVPLGAARRKRQNWIEPVQSLNGGLLIHTADGGILGWVKVHPMTSAALVSKSGTLLAMYRFRRCGFNQPPSRRDVRHLC
jgi:hypothetical protein